MTIVAVAAMGLSFLAAAPAWGAQEWSPLDARSRSLGGAGVAFADGRADSLYWNPASLAVGSEKVLDFSTGFSFSLSFFTDEHVVGSTASDIFHVVDLYDNLKFSDIQNSFNGAGPGSPVATSDLQSAMQIIDGITALGKRGEGVLATEGAGFNLRVGPFGLFVHGLADVGAAPIVDFTGTSWSTNPAAFFTSVNTTSTAPPAPLTGSAAALANAMVGAGLSAQDAKNLAYNAEQALGPTAIADPAFVNAMTQIAHGTATGSTTDLYNNPSGAILRAVGQMEVGLSFALPVIPTVFDLGISVKDVIVESSWSAVTFADKDSEDSLNHRIRTDLTKDNLKRTSHFNADLGGQVHALDWLTLAISARNIVPMTVDFGGPGGTAHLDPQARFGALFQPLSFLKLGGDIDLLRNESPVLPGYFTRHAGAGAEFDFPVIKLRVGYDDNLAFSGDHGRLTAGLGLDFFGFLVIDVGAQASLVKTEYKPANGTTAAKTVPSDRASAGITIGANFPF
jgi:hypothetical protein